MLLCNPINEPRSPTLRGVTRISSIWGTDIMMSHNVTSLLDCPQRKWHWQLQQEKEQGLRSNLYHLLWEELGSDCIVHKIGIRSLWAPPSLFLCLHVHVSQQHARSWVRRTVFSLEQAGSRSSQLGVGSMLKEGGGGRLGVKGTPNPPPPQIPHNLLLLQLHSVSTKSFLLYQRCLLIVRLYNFAFLWQMEDLGV